MLKLQRLLVLLLASSFSLAVAAAGRELAPLTTAPTVYAAHFPHVAHAQGRFLTIWRESMGSVGSPVMAALSDSSGHRISEKAFPLALPPIGNVQSMRLAGAGDGFVLLWQEFGPATRLAWIDREGRVTSIHEVPLPAYNEAELAWNGTHLLVVVQRASTYRAEAFVLERDGRVVRGAVALPSELYAYEIVPLHDRFVVFSAGWHGLYVQTIAQNGLTDHQVIEAAEGSPASAYRPLAAVATAAANGDILVVWSGGRHPGAELKSAVYRADKTLTPANFIVAHTAPIRPIGIFGSGDSPVVAYTMYDSNQSTMKLWHVRLAATGERVSAPVVMNETIGFSPQSAAGNDVLLTAFQSGHPTRVWTVAAGADARPRTAQLASIGWSRQSQPALAAGDGRVLATWTEQAGDAAAAKATSLNAEGERSAVSHLALAFLASREAAWNGTHYLVVHRDVSRLMATRVDANGTPVDHEPIVLAPIARRTWEPFASVVWNGSHWVVVYAEEDKLAIVDVSRGGFPTVPRPLDVHAPLDPSFVSREVRPPAMAFDGTNILLVWTELHYPPCSFPLCSEPTPLLYLARLTREGARRDMLGLEVTEELPLSLASNGANFLLLAGRRAYTLDLNRTAIDIDHGRDVLPFAAIGDVTWDGRHYVVTLRYQIRDWHLSLHTLDARGVETSAPRGTRTLPPDYLEPPSVASHSPGNAVVGINEGTAAAGVRAVVYRESDFTLLPAAPAAPQNVRVMPLTRFPYGFEVSWEAPPAGEVEAYVIEERHGDRWTEVRRVDAGARRAAVGSMTVRVRALNAGGLSAPAEAARAASRRRSVR